MFLSPRPTDLITVPCCVACNNVHAGFDERLRMVACMPFDRNTLGQRVVNEAVLGKTLATGRQMKFAASVLRSMKPVPGHHDLLHVQIDGEEFIEGMIRITKGLLFVQYPGF